MLSRARTATTDPAINYVQADLERLDLPANPRDTMGEILLLPNRV